MGLLATLKVMLGIDSVDYQAKLRQATGDTEKFAVAVGASAGRVKERMTSGIAEPLALAGLAAARFGGQITSSFLESTGVMSKLAVQTNGVWMATSRLADTALLAVASFGQLSKTRISARELNAGIVGLGVSAAQAGWAIGRLLAEVTGLDAALREKAGKPAEELAGALVKDKERFKEAADQLARLTAQLHLSGPAWAFEAKWTRENAIRVSELTDKVTALVQSKRQVTIQGGVYLAGLLAEENVHRRNIATLDALRLKFDQSYGVMTKPQLTDALSKLAGDVRKMAEQGIPWAQVMDKVSPRFKELADFAGTYISFNMPGEAQALAEAFRDDTGLALDSLLRKWATMAPAVKTGVEDSQKYLEQMGKDLEGSISGGFGRGAEEGVNFARQQMDAWRAELESQPIKLRIDLSSVQKAFDDLMKGRIPITTGSAP